MKITNKKINDIKPYGRNPRKNDEAVEYVKQSIKEFGFKVPVVIDRNNVIVTGHTRVKAAKELGFTEVPCIVADDLTDEQIKAFRLADNKVSEYAEWDFGLLDQELDEIFDIDMELFGFEFEEEDEEDEEERKNERERTFEEYNLNDVDSSRLTEYWQMPVLKKCDHVPDDLISFNYMLTSEQYDKGIHFYIDDYQFERIWNSPHQYMDRLTMFDCVLTPDFSLYREMPLPMQIWNVYRSKMIGQIMQDYGIDVIPTLQWCHPDSYDFCFDGIQGGGTVSVSTIGVKREDEAAELWFNGMDAAIDTIKPKTVVVYGGDIGYPFSEDIKVIYINNHNAERMKE